MEAIVLCEAFGWELNNYWNYPNWYIDLSILKRRADEKLEKSKANKAKK